MTFKGVGPGGADIYDVKFANGAQEWRIWLDAGWKDRERQLPRSVATASLRTSRPLRLRLFALSLLFAASAPARVAAQGGPGAVEGVAKTEEDSTPIQFALVRLVPVDPKSAVVQQGITSAQGRFRFSSVLAGDYKLELLRIGYRPVVSAIQVRSGETVQAGLRGSLRPFPLPTVIVYPEAACLNSAELSRNSYLSAIWEEIRDGVEIRRGFEQRYRYSLSLIETTDIKIPSRPDQHRQKSDTVVNEPDSFLAREAQQRARRQAEGYGNGNNVALPDEEELLDDAFLREHCVVPVVQDADGAIRSTLSASRQASRRLWPSGDHLGRCIHPLDAAARIRVPGRRQTIWPRHGGLCRPRRGRRHTAATGIGIILRTIAAGPVRDSRHRHAEVLVLGIRGSSIEVDARGACIWTY